MANKWLAHVKKTMKKMKQRGTDKKSFKDVLKEAKRTYKKGGGDDSSSDEEKPLEVEPTIKDEVDGGRRRRRGRKVTKRRARK